MTAAMSQGAPRPPHNNGVFPFQKLGDPRDTPAVGHVRNFSNYLLPRGRSVARNLAEAASIILRGIVANSLQVATVLIGMAVLTNIAYPTEESLYKGSFVPRFFDAVLTFLGYETFAQFNHSVGEVRFAFTGWMLFPFALLLLWWAIERSILQRFDARGLIRTFGDTASPMLLVTSNVLGAILIVALLDLAPVMIHALSDFYVRNNGTGEVSTKSILAALTALLAAVGSASGKLGYFFKVTPRPSRWSWLWRAGLIWLAAIALPVMLLILYLHLSAWGMADLNGVVPRPFTLAWPPLYYVAMLVLLISVTFSFEPNSYSLHQFYRDRLSKAFLFDPQIIQGTDPAPLDDLKLSSIDETAGPYQIVNAAMNVQGSKEANRRGRDADFFIFTKDYLGSDLTLYAPTSESLYANTIDMERIDPALDLASAMAISGAAVAANMGATTIRPLSPTLALLNIRLGYWLRNPRDLAKPRTTLRTLGDFRHRLFSRFYLLLEMLNFIDEQSRRILLTDGGHIENLGMYELLKRGCQLIIAIDGEADPTMSFAALNKVERYARIDFGVRIDLPWQDISHCAKIADALIESGPSSTGPAGPHCAMGRILYADGSEGLLLYVKASLSGDEPDYVLDYKKRNPSFPHETTGDQFFSEEQFEAYRSVGFHIVDHLWNEADDVAISSDLVARGATVSKIMNWVRTKAFA